MKLNPWSSAKRIKTNPSGSVETFATSQGSVERVDPYRTPIEEVPLWALVWEVEEALKRDPSLSGDALMDAAKKLYVERYH